MYYMKIKCKSKLFFILSVLVYLISSIYCSNYGSVRHKKLSRLILFIWLTDTIKSLVFFLTSSYTATPLKKIYDDPLSSILWSELELFRNVLLYTSIVFLCIIKEKLLYIKFSNSLIQLAEVLTFTLTWVCIFYIYWSHIYLHNLYESFLIFKPFFYYFAIALTFYFSKIHSDGSVETILLFYILLIFKSKWSPNIFL